MANHKFKSNRRGYTHMHPMPVFITLEGHYVAQPLHVQIPEPTPMPVCAGAREHHVYVPMSEEDRLWTRARSFGWDNDPRYKGRYQ
jgi:hypothetical protein